ncbi:MAG TPA: hypothetical protein VFA07_17590 [Chthonomonadaceae bacterium]|nr:hypothetical protein [Chthonomonadaceae bacterium]
MTQQLNHPEKTTAEIKKLLRRLGSEKEDVRFVAEQELFDLGPPAVDHLLVYLKKLASRRYALPWIMLGRFVITGTLGSFMIAMVDHLLGRAIHIGGFIGAFIGGSGAAAYPVYRDFKRSRNAAARVLARFEDVRAVGALAVALEFSDEETYSAVHSSLLRLLPRLQASDASLLSKRQRECLYRALGSNSRLTVAILKALEQIGDEEALPYVESMTHFYMPDVREAAIACLPYIQQRAEQERIRQTLLRPSSANETTPVFLLRPTTGAAEDNLKQLLRPNEE